MRPIFSSLFLLLLVSAASCVSDEPGFGEKLTFKLGVFPRGNGYSVRSALIVETRDGSSYSVRKVNIPSVAAAEDRWAEAADSAAGTPSERAAFNFDGRLEKFQYPAKGIYLKVRVRKTGGNSAEIRGFFRHSGEGIGGKAVETPFSGTLLLSNETTLLELERAVTSKAER